MTPDLISLLQAYLQNVNKPTDTWPKNEILRYTAIEYTVDTLCHSLYSNRNCIGKEATWVVDRYLKRVTNNYDKMQEETNAGNMQFFWVCCILCAQELKSLYFDC